MDKDASCHGSEPVKPNSDAAVFPDGIDFPPQFLHIGQEPEIKETA